MMQIKIVKGVMSSFNVVILEDIVLDLEFNISVFR